MAESMVRTSFSCSKVVMDKLDEMAKIQNRSRSSLLTIVLNSFVETETKGEVKGTVQRKKSRIKKTAQK